MLQLRAVSGGGFPLSTQADACGGEAAVRGLVLSWGDERGSVAFLVVSKLRKHWSVNLRYFKSMLISKLWHTASVQRLWLFFYSFGGVVIWRGGFNVPALW